MIFFLVCTTALMTEKFIILHHIVTGDEKWVHYNDAKHRKSQKKPKLALILSAKLNIHGSKLQLSIWWHQLGLLYMLFKLKKPIKGGRYWLQLMGLGQKLKEKVSYRQMQNKWIFYSYIVSKNFTCLNQIKLVDMIN